ncbi:hypothetical protein G6O69_36915 [Pseudenhygromyxa sp. WMMC2535]|uniref:hypothetical protein n=1 Tax=Pseudenhygromyxa sp. WMMC2535 TaxID=2712867 RepID=UPI0015951972|nr:hypothetical protein [Pseudenhygromyxa sp. WMMC2535]NVB37268.1 hypothetical protein [Pseudenhygromyxa sp. WMMC2535]NVB43463.1 hypothetical protein [Pseudenhygromyxa sp. WMMC2535]
MPPSPLSVGRQALRAGRWALGQSEKRELLDEFEQATTEHSLAMLDSLLAAMTQHAIETGSDPQWLAALDDSLPPAQRAEALTLLKDAFLSVLRLSHDPILGNEMLALVAAGVHKVSAPSQAIPRILSLAPQLVPQDLELLKRYMIEGVENIEETPEGSPRMFPRKMLQHDFKLYFISPSGVRSHPLDSYSYQALKRHSLIRDTPWWQDPERPRGKPKSPPGMSIGTVKHEPFKMEWMLTELGWALLEAVNGRRLIELWSTWTGRAD